MIKKLALGLMSLGLAVGAYAATPGTDNAADAAYNLGWTEGTDGGTPATFNPWSLTENNNNGTTVFAGYFIGDSTAGSGDINTSGKSFGVFANPAGAYANANRSFDSALDVGQTFSIDLAVNFRNGNKGINLYSGGTGGVQLFNFNVGSDMYSIQGTDTGLAYDPASVFHLAFTQDTLGGGTYSVSRGASVFSGSYTGDIDALRLYNAGTNGGEDGAADNLYANNLSITAPIPEPATVLLVGPALLGGMFFVRRRRT